MRFRNREHAAKLLLERLRAAYQNTNPLVLGVPRGAMPMAEIIVNGLGGELDVVLVHKLTHPEQPELAIGAMDEEGQAFVSEWAANLHPAYIESEKSRQLHILKRRRALYTPGRGAIDPKGRIVIVVDDGIATGSTLTAALRAVRVKEPKKLIAVAAVASPEAARRMSEECDAVVCLNVPASFYSVGQYFDDFAEVKDEDVARILSHRELRAAANE